MRVDSKLLKIAAAAPKALSEALDETADFILSLIRLSAPVKTGALRDSYKKQRNGQLSILIGSALLYSVFMEFGTSRAAAQPHLIPAFLQAEQFLQDRIEDKIQKLL